MSSLQLLARQAGANARNALGPAVITARNTRTQALLNARTQSVQLLSKVNPKMNEIMHSGTPVRGLIQLAKTNPGMAALGVTTLLVFGDETIESLYAELDSITDAAVRSVIEQGIARFIADQVSLLHGNASMEPDGEVDGKPFVFTVEHWNMVEPHLRRLTQHFSPVAFEALMSVLRMEPDVRTEGWKQFKHERNILTDGTA